MTHVPQIAVSLYVYVITLGHLTYIVKLNRKVLSLLNHKKLTLAERFREAA